MASADGRRGLGGVRRTDLIVVDDPVGRRAAGVGTETLVVPDFTWSLPAYWSVFDDGIYYAAREDLPDNSVVHHFRFFEFASRRSSALGTLSGTIEHWSAA